METIRGLSAVHDWIYWWDHCNSLCIVKCVYLHSWRTSILFINIYYYSAIYKDRLYIWNKFVFVLLCMWGKILFLFYDVNWYYIYKCKIPTKLPVISMQFHFCKKNSVSAIIKQILKNHLCNTLLHYHVVFNLNSQMSAHWQSSCLVLESNALWEMAGWTTMWCCLLSTLIKKDLRELMDTGGELHLVFKAMKENLIKLESVQMRW